MPSKKSDPLVKNPHEMANIMIDDQSVLVYGHSLLSRLICSFYSLDSPSLFWPLLLLSLLNA